MIRSFVSLMRLPVSGVLIIPFVLQLLTSVVIVAYLSHHSGQKDLDHLAEELREQTTRRISDHLDNHLQLQQQILSVNSSLIKNASLDPIIREQLRQVFWRNIHISDYLSSLVFANELGQEIGYNKVQTTEVIKAVEKVVKHPVEAGTIYIVQSSESKQRKFSTVDQEGKPTQESYIFPYDVRRTGWYQDAKKLKKQGWSSVYVGQVIPSLNISAILPIYDQNGNFAGALNNTIALSQISQFLTELKFSSKGQVFILDSSANVIASSDNLSLVETGKPNPVHVINGFKSKNKWLKAILEKIKDQHGNLEKIPSHFHLNLTVEGEVIYGDIQKYQDQYGLNWHLLVVIPESDFMTQIKANRSQTLIFCGITLVISTIIGIITARLITKPIYQLNQASQTLAKGGILNYLPRQKMIKEIDDLTQSFRLMAQYLQESQKQNNLSLDQLATQNHQLQQILDAVPFGIRIIDTQLKIRYANQQAIKITGKGKVDFDQIEKITEIYQAHILNMDILYPVENLPIIRALKGECHHIDDIYILSNGQKIPLEAWGTPIYNQAGEIEYGMVVFQDISDRKKTENALKENQDFLKKIADSSPNIIYIFDIQEKRNIYVNREIWSVLGYQPEEIQQMGVHFFDNVMHPDDLIKLPAEYEKLALAQDGIVYHFEYRMKNTKGEWRWLYSRHTVFSRDQQGQVKCTIGTAEDITEHRAAQQQLEKSNQELIRASRLKDEFLAMMSHELRTPLNAILGMTEALEDQIFGLVNTQQIKALNTIEKSGLHLLNLINDILDLSKIEAGQVKLELTQISVKSLCNSSLEIVKPQAIKKQILIESYLPDYLPEIIVDERRMIQVLINLLNNAIKFTHEGGQVTLKVVYPHIIDQKNYLHFMIEDNGIGIAPQHLEHLFKPFIQIDSALNRKYEGTGLGLALVKKLIDLHGGQISVNSEEKVGSCFMIDLPITQAETAPLTPLKSNQLKADPLEIKSSCVNHPVAPLILLVEDNPANIFTIKNYLEAKGYQVLIAQDGEKAISLTKLKHPDLILMDISMPMMDGFTAIKSIREDPLINQIPIIALTALAMEGDQDRCLEAGANQYLSKPVKLKSLVEMINDQLNQKLLNNPASPLTQGVQE